MEAFSTPFDFNPLVYAVFSPLCAYILLVFLIWALLTRRYAYVTVITLVTNFGIGYVPVGPLTFARVCFGLATLGAGWEALQIMHKPALNVNPSGKFPPYTKLMLCILAVVLLKSIFDTLALGLDVYRLSAWKRVITAALLPSVLLALSFGLQPTRKTVEDYFRAFLLIISIWLVTGLAGAFFHDPAKLFVAGDLRLVLHNNDTISSVKLIPLLIVSLCWLTLVEKRKWVVFLGYGGMVCSLLIVVLSGTRQIALSSAALLLLFMVMRGQARWAGIWLVIALVAYIPYNSFKHAALPLRVDREGIYDFGRIEIWTAAYRSLMASPLSGLGYRTWGDVSVGWDVGNGLPTDQKDTAHGLFQDLTVDHGLLIGGAFFISYLLVAGFACLRIVREGDVLGKIGAVAFVGTSLSYFLSGAFHSCEQFVMALGLYIICGVASGKKQPEPGMLPSLWLRPGARPSGSLNQKALLKRSVH